MVSNLAFSTPYTNLRLTSRVRNMCLSDFSKYYLNFEKVDEGLLNFFYNQIFLGEQPPCMPIIIYPCCEKPCFPTIHHNSELPFTLVLMHHIWLFIKWFYKRKASDLLLSDDFHVTNTLFLWVATIIWIFVTFYVHLFLQCLMSVNDLVPYRKS